MITGSRQKIARKQSRLYQLVGHLLCQFLQDDFEPKIFLLCHTCLEESDTTALLLFFQTCYVNVDKKGPLAVDTSEKKRILLVSDFYYGRFEGDTSVTIEKTNTTFKCRSCLKILKNNIR